MEIQYNVTNEIKEKQLALYSHMRRIGEDIQMKTPRRHEGQGDKEIDNLEDVHIQKNNDDKSR